jgi:hypothetical protein
MSVKLRAVDEGLPTEEDALLTAIVASPGISVRELARSLERRPETVVRLTQRLVERGAVERKPLMRKRTDGREHTYPGLYAAEGPAVVVESPPTAPLSPDKDEQGAEKPVTASPASPQRVALLGLGERLQWSRLPITQAREFGGGFKFGRAIQGGEDGWRQAVQALSDEEVELALIAGRHLLTLMGLG